MNALTESLAATLESQGISLDRALLARCVPRLKCELSTSNIEGLDAETIVIKVLEIVAGMPGLSTKSLDKSADQQSAEVATTEGAQSMDQGETNEQNKAYLERRVAIRKAIEEAAREIERLGDPANEAVSQFERKGYSWSLSL